jgi:protein-S-isoprenylcysteine O-methyltransferase Ste14
VVRYPPMVSFALKRHDRPQLALSYAWCGVAVMWAFWVSFVIFLAEPRHILAWWPLPTVDRSGSVEQAFVAGLIDLASVTLFGLQHSIMARPWFKQRVMQRMPGGLQRATYVHMANLVLFLLILFWKPIPTLVWKVEATPAQEVLWLLFAAGWVILFLGGWSFGMRELLGIEQARAWSEGRSHTSRLKTGSLYRWVRHPMYVGVLMGVWATPRMSFGHLLLAFALTAYVLIAMRYEERDLLHRFGARYRGYRGLPETHDMPATTFSSCQLASRRQQERSRPCRP